VSETRATSRRARRRSPWPRRLLVSVLVLLVFALGIAVGKALNDGPPTPATETYVRTLTALTDEEGTTSP
jgi:hypothetical protein